MTDEELEAQFTKEAEGVEAERLLSDEGFDQIRRLSLQEIAELPEDMRRKFFATSRWHFNQRCTIDSIEGMMIGGKSIDEVLKEQERQEKGQGPTTSST